MVEERKTLSFLRRLKLRFVLSARLADSFARLASSPGVEVSDFPLGKKGGLRGRRASSGDFGREGPGFVRCAKQPSK